MDEPRNANSRRRPSGSQTRWCSKSPTTPCTSMSGVLVGDPGRGLPQRLLGDVEGDEALQVAGLDHRVEQEPRLLGRSRAGLDERVRRGQPRDVARVLGEDDALAPGEVVLGQLRDLLEEHRAALVVEPLRRQLLRRRREALADVFAQRVQAVLGSEVDVDLQRRGGRAVAQASLAQRKPAKICRRIGKSQLRNVTRATVGLVAQEAPRSTLYSGPKNTSEYSAYGNAWKPG